MQVTLTSSDGFRFCVDRRMALQSGTIQAMLEDDDTVTQFPVPNVNGRTLEYVVEYVSHHDAGGASEEWDERFMDRLPQKDLFEVILAANYLNVRALLDCMCKRVAFMIRGKSPAEIRVLFDIRNDFTPEEEDELQRENQWAFE